MNAASTIPGILDEYCWMPSHPRGWDCETCWTEIHLTRFFATVGEYAATSHYRLCSSLAEATLPEPEVTPNDQPF